MTKKIISLILSILMVFGVGSVAACADGTFSALNYNVAGLPDPQVLIGNSSNYVIEKETEVGKQLNLTDIDIIAVQEDFNYHSYLAAEMTNYAYTTTHSGGIPVGDGMNIWSNFPIYNSDRITWNKLSGIIEGGADELTPKGMLWTVIEIEEGVYIDFVDIHADAYGDEGSVEARIDNFNQLATLIKNRTTDRPIIITGDYNEYMLDDNTAIREILCEGCGLKDAFAELYNNGEYQSSVFYRTNHPDAGDKWGNWDSVERYLYKDGGGVFIEALSYEMVDFINPANNQPMSDHSAAICVFKYTVSEDNSTESDDLGGDKQSALVRFISQIFSFLKSFFLLLGDWDNLKGLLGI